MSLLDGFALVCIKLSITTVFAGQSYQRAKKAAKAERQKKYEWVFMNGKQVRIKKREPTVDGMPVDEFIMKNAEQIWFNQNEMWELIPNTD